MKKLTNFNRFDRKKGYWMNAVEAAPAFTWGDCSGEALSKSEPFANIPEALRFTQSTEQAFYLIKDINIDGQSPQQGDILLAYNKDISMGKVRDRSLKSILSGNKFLTNLRKKGGEKHLTCRKCFGEPTYRGTLVKKLYFALPTKIRNSKFMTFFTQSY